MSTDPDQLYSQLLDAASREVLGELTAPTPIPQDVLEKASAAYAEVWGDTRKAGATLEAALDGFDWDWPAWATVAKSRRAETLARARAIFEKSRWTSILHGTSISVVDELCSQHGVVFDPAAPAFRRIEALVRALRKTKQLQVLEPLAHDAWLHSSRYVRKPMAQELARRIAKLTRWRADHVKRLDPGYLGLNPFWRFEWGGRIDSDCPKACKKFDGKVLHHTKAQTAFPVLPCHSLNCHCSIYTQRLGDPIKHTSTPPLTP